MMPITFRSVGHQPIDEKLLQIQYRQIQEKAVLSSSFIYNVDRCTNGAYF